jgi:hypothetical protein
MAPLRHPLSRFGCSGEVISLEEGHAFEVLGKHARREKACDAPAGDDCVVKRTGHRRCSLSRVEALN